MRTILHIFKKDSRQQRGGLVFWLLLLTFRSVIDHQDLNFDSVGAPALNILILYLLFGSILVIIPMIRSDALGNHDAFYRTRPIGIINIIIAKILFLAVWMIIPFVGFDMLYLANQGLPFPFIMAAAAEQTLFFSVLVLAIGATATQFPSNRAAVQTLLACLPLPFIASPLWSEIGTLLHLPGLKPSILSPHGMLILSLFVIAVIGAAVWRATWHRDRWFVRWAPFAGVALCLPMFSGNWQSHFGTSRPLSSEINETSSLAASGLLVSAYDNSIDPTKAQVQMTLTPTSPHNPQSVIEWAVTDMTVRDHQSKVQSEPFHPPTGKVFYRRTHSHRKNKDLEAIASLLPTKTRFAHTGTGQWTRRSSATGSVSTDRSTQVTEQASTVEGTVRGRHFRWRLVGEIPLNEAAQLDSHETTWRYLGVKRSRSEAFDIKLAWNRPELRLSRNQYWKWHGEDPLSRHEFLLHQPDDNLVFTPQSTYNHIGRGLFTGFQRSVITLQFQHTTDRDLRLPPVNLVNAKILVFEKNYEGEEVMTWRKEGIRLANQFHATGNTNSRPPEKLPRAEFQRRLKALGPPPMGADRGEAGRYLYQIIKLVQARDEWVQSSDPLAIQLAPLAQEHPEMFLDGLRNAHHRAAQLLEAVIRQGIADHQKGLVIERLPQLPSLASMILERDWLEPAREALATLAHERANLPISVVRALILLDEPDVLPHLHEDFHGHPTLDYYDALRTVPSVQTELDQIVRSLWSQRPRVFGHRMNQNALYSIVLRHGIRDPLDEIFQILDWFEHEDYSNGYNISRAIQENVLLDEIPRYQRNDTRQVLGWLVKQRPEWFHYDPARRLFYVKKA